MPLFAETLLLTSNDGWEYRIEAYRQPLQDWLVASGYDWYIMHFPVKVPGWRRVEKFLARWADPPSFASKHRARWYDRLASWSINQDIRCYKLGRKNRTVVATAILTEEELYERDPTSYWSRTRRR